MRAAFRAVRYLAPMKSTLLAFVVGLVVIGCGSPQRPVTFLTSAKPESAIDTVSRTLAAEGQAPASADRQANIIQTEWKDTGFMYGQIQNTTATIVRRYTVTLAPTNDGSNVTVRVDTKRCPKDGFTVNGNEVRGTCEESTAIPGQLQDDLDDLAAKIRVALGGTPPATR